MTREERKNLYDKYDSIVPMAEKDGQVYVDFEQASIMNSVHAEEGKGTGMQLRNRDGSLASTGKTVHAINPEYFFANRYKLKGKKLHVVSGHDTIGYRCIKEQSSGHIYIKTIPCYIIARNEKGELVLEKQTTISDTEFISDFTNTLDHKSMAEILPLITEHGNEMTADSMPI